MKLRRVAWVAIPLLCGCASQRVASNVKLMGFDENVSKGKSIGEVRGESCSWRVLNYPVTRDATLDEAFADVRTKAGGLRYLKSVTTENSGFDAQLFAKHCLEVRGVAYK